MFSRWDFKRLLADGYVDIIQPDLSHAGGISEVKKIASMAEAYDVAHFPELKEKYDVMSVPCIVLNRGGRQTVEFGKKNVSQMLDLIDAL